MIASVEAASNCPSYADSPAKFESIVRNALLDILGDPGNPKLKITSDELNDLSTFYSAYKDGSKWNDANCLNKYATGKSIREILEKYSGLYEGSSCNIVTRTWSKAQVPVTQVYQDTLVDLDVVGEGVCVGERIGFIIKEDDFLDADDDVGLNPLQVDFGIDNKAKGVWKTEFQDDGLFGGNPEYYFKTVYNGKMSNEQSPLLEVLFCKDEDGDTYKDKLCGGLDCEDTAAGRGGVIGKDINPSKIEVCNDVDDNCKPVTCAATDLRCPIDDGLLADGCACSPGADAKFKTKGTTNADSCDNWDNNCNGKLDEDLRSIEQWWLKKDEFVGKVDFNVCVVDFDGDKCSGVNDFVLFINALGTKSGDANYLAKMDLNQGTNPYAPVDSPERSSSGVIDMSDLDVFLSVYTGACPLDKKCSEAARPECGQNIGSCTKGLAKCWNNDVWVVVENVHNPLYPSYCEGAVSPHVEVCDDAAPTIPSKDEDCDGLVNENLETRYYEDKDKDTYGNLASTKLACAKPNEYVLDKTDCNDYDTDINTNEASIHPNAAEMCNNQDEDCDSVKDEGLSWCQCNGGSPSQNDLCDGRDNDCDNQVDEDVRLQDNWWKTCSIDFDNDKCTSIYEMVVLLNSYGRCEGNSNYDPRANLARPGATAFSYLPFSANNPIPSGERCVNNDDFYLMLDLLKIPCEGQSVQCTSGNVDSSRSCGVDNGPSDVCTLGKVSCFYGVWPNTVTMSALNLDNPLFNQLCNGAGKPGPSNALSLVNGATQETLCDNLDNDCDGLVDENAQNVANGLKNTCKDYTGSVTGNRCGTYTVCGACPAAPAEVCGALADGLTPNDIDEDCDGAVDEDVNGLVGGLRKTCPRKADNGACLPSVPYCTSSCPALPNSAEVCNNADDDCDGIKDEGLETWCACSAGQNAHYTAGKDLCDGWDNDCDSGKADGTSNMPPNGQGGFDEDEKQAGTEWWNVCKVEFTQDGCVGVADLAYLLEAFPSTMNTPLYNSHIRADVTGQVLLPDYTYKYTGVPDGEIDFTDYFFMVALFQPAGCPGDVPCSPEGAVSSDTSKTCGINVGECKKGLIKCFAGLWPSDAIRASILPGHPYFTSTCGSNSGLGFNLVTPAAEKCDNNNPGKDEDCDGSVNENWPTKGQTCGGSVCVNAGTYVCNSAQNGLICAGALNKALGTNCDDGLFCRVSSTCNDQGVCGGVYLGVTLSTPNSCSDSNVCTTDSCDEANDRCVNTAGNNGASCGAVSCTAPNTEGSCTKYCSGGTASTCGTCTPSCTCVSGYNDCNGLSSDGCETNGVCCTTTKGEWGAFTSYGTCDATACGVTGKKTRSRVCNDPYPSCGGSNCVCPAGHTCEYINYFGTTTYRDTESQDCSFACPPPPPSCTLTSCGTCIASTGCGWCTNGNGCKYGSSTGGPVDGSCWGVTWIWSGGTCPLPPPPPDTPCTYVDVSTLDENLWKMTCLSTSGDNACGKIGKTCQANTLQYKYSWTGWIASSYSCSTSCDSYAAANYRVCCK